MLSGSERNKESNAHGIGNYLSLALIVPVE